MHAEAALPRTIPLSTSWPRRWLRQAAELWQAAAQHFARRRAAAAVEWTLDDVAQLDEATLRDIGVPVWLREEAAARRESQRTLLNAQAGGSDLFTGRW